MIKKIVLGTFLFCQLGVAYCLPTGKYTVLVTDENNIPIEGAEARLSFMKPKSSGWGGITIGVTGVTDKDGYYTGDSPTEPYLVYSARADGYYSSGHKFTAFTGVDGILGFRKWQPWNPTLKVVLKKKINPIAMYAYYSGMMKIPAAKGDIGYDLVKRDWVSPYGKGITADFLFRLEGEFRSMKDSNVNFALRFTNKSDGLRPFIVEKKQGSNFISSHHAPLTGYQSNLRQSRVLEPGKKSVTSYEHESNYNYYFRVRCDGDDESTCIYGKIYNRIEFAARGFLSFQYYLNPTPGDTNVEFDPKKNLFKNLENKITAP